MSMEATLADLPWVLLMFYKLYPVFFTIIMALTAIGAITTFRTVAKSIRDANARRPSEPPRAVALPPDDGDPPR
jgi:hypothetical protein